MTRRDQKLRTAQRRLAEARTAIIEAMALNDREPMSKQYGGMDLARAADNAAEAASRIDDARLTNGYGQRRA